MEDNWVQVQNCNWLPEATLVVSVLEDSRHWGPVPKKYIVGKIQLRWWPPHSAQLF